MGATGRWYLAVRWPARIDRVCLGEGVMVIGRKVLNKAEKTLLTVFFGYMILYYALLLWFINKPIELMMVTDVLSPAGGLIAAAAVYYVYRAASGISKRFWLIMLIGYLCYTAGDLAWFYIELMLQQEVPYPSICDFFYLLQTVFAIAAAMYVSNTATSKAFTIRRILESLLVICAIFTFSWEYFISPILAESEISIVSQIISMAYPLMDLGLIIVIYFLRQIWHKLSFRVTIVQMGMGLFALLDTIYLYQTNYGLYDVGSLLDPLWILALFLIATAGFATPALSEDDRVFRDDSLRRVLPTAFPVITNGVLVLLIAMMVKQNLSMVMAGYAAVNLLLIWRQYITYDDNRKLSSHLQDSITDLETSQKAIERQNRELEKLAADCWTEARTDYLTNTHNRRYLGEILDTLDSQRQNNQMPFSVLMIDIDRFKQINDEFGHLVGDDTLQAVSRILKRHLRAGDEICRAGGDEFVIILPGIGKNEALLIAERIRRDVQGFSLKKDPFEICCTVSIGIAESDGRDITLFETLKRADASLYEAKDRGRNQSI